MRRYTMGMALVLAACSSAGRADPLTIDQVQYTTDPQGDSPYAGQIIDLVGGVVTHVSFQAYARVFLQDPARSSWGAIQVKDFTVGWDLAFHVQVGDWVALQGVYVEEFVGNTFLQYGHPVLSPDSSYQILSSGNPLPAPIVVSAAQIAAPIEQPNGDWIVADHMAEPYEHMLLQVRGVTVTAMDLGKAVDNYALTDMTGDCWAADYMNQDVYTFKYHDWVRLGRRFHSVTGVLEQYTAYHDGHFWDYYQLLTRRTDDLVVAGDFDRDGDVDDEDYTTLSSCWSGPGGTIPDLAPEYDCPRCDLDDDADVDLIDYATMQTNTTGP